MRRDLYFRAASENTTFVGSYLVQSPACILHNPMRGESLLIVAILSATACIGTIDAGSPATAPGDVRIPLCPGLTMVGAVSEPQGDYEPIMRVESVTAQAVTLHYSSQVPTRTGSIRNINIQRVV